MAKGILVADDHRHMRTVVCALLISEGYTICGQASNGIEAIQLTRELSPEMAILNISMPVLSGLLALPEMLRAAPNMKVIILTAHESNEIRRQVFGLGAHAFVTKDTLPDALLDEVRRLFQDR